MARGSVAVRAASNACRETGDGLSEIGGRLILEGKRKMHFFHVHHVSSQFRSGTAQSRNLPSSPICRQQAVRISIGNKTPCTKTSTTCIDCNKLYARANSICKWRKRLIKFGSNYLCSLNMKNIS